AKNYTYGVSFGTSIEIFGADTKKPPPRTTPSLSLGLRLYYNNYKGIGYSLSPSFGYNASKDLNSTGSGANIGLSLDSQEGVGANASVSITTPGNDSGKNPRKSFTQGIGFNSKRGLNLSMSMSVSRRYFDKNKKQQSASMGGSSSISFAEQSYVPAV